MAKFFMHLAKEPNTDFLSVRQGIRQIAKKQAQRTLEVVYFGFFLPLSAYNIGGTYQAYVQNLFVFSITFVQLTILLSRQIFEKRRSEYALFLNKIGYWKKTAFENLNPFFVLERVEWIPKSDPKMLQNKQVVLFQGGYYRRLYPTGSYGDDVEKISWFDELIIKLVLGDREVLKVIRLISLTVALVQLLQAWFFFFEFAPIFQLLAYILILI